MTPEAEIVAAWHDALNRGDVERLISLVTADVEIGGPRGTTSGAQIVREWFGRANVRMIPLRWFVSGSSIVVEERGEWLSPETGDITSTQIVSTAFIVANALITSIVRYDDLATALKAAGLQESDQVEPL